MKKMIASVDYNGFSIISMKKMIFKRDKAACSVDCNGFSILELSELISAFEKTFGIKAKEIKTLKYEKDDEPEYKKIEKRKKRNFK